MALYICFKDLGASYLENWDEAWYGQVVREMLSTKNFLVPHWNYQAFVDKPPLQFWLTSGIASVIGLNEFSVRLLSAISGFFCILLVTIYSYKKWGTVPAIFAYLTLALNNIFIWRTRTGNLDAFATLLILLIFFLTTSTYKYRYLLIGLLLGLTFLQKASLAYYPAAIFLLHELIYQTKNIPKNLPQYILTIIIAISLPLFWLNLAKGQQPNIYQYFLTSSDQGVTKLSLASFKLNYFWHVYYSLQRRFIYLFGFGLLSLLLVYKKRPNLTILALALGLPIALSFTLRDNNWYLVPSIPFWSIAIASGVSLLLKLIQKIRLLPIIYIFYLGLFSLTSYTAYKTLTVNIQSIIQGRSSTREVATALFIHKFASPQDLLIRLDHNYPTTIYYSQLKTEVKVGDPQSVFELAQTKKARWIAGNTVQIQGLVKYFPQAKIYEVGSESVLQLY